MTWFDSGFDCCIANRSYDLSCVRNLIKEADIGVYRVFRTEVHIVRVTFPVCAKLVVFDFMSHSRCVESGQSVFKRKRRMLASPQYFPP